MREGFPYEHVCLGALVNERQVITAGHCFQDKTLYREEAQNHPERFKIIPLDLNIDVDLDKNPRDFVAFQASHINIHPDFEFTATFPFEIKNDIAIVTMKDASTRETIDIGSLRPKDKCWTVLWEVNKADEFDAKYYLKEFPLESVDDQACRSRYANMAKFDQRFVCTHNLFKNEFAVRSFSTYVGL